MSDNLESKAVTCVDDHVAASLFGLCARVFSRDTRNSFILGNFLTNRESHCLGVFWKLLGCIARFDDGQSGALSRIEDASPRRGDIRKFAAYTSGGRPMNSNKDAVSPGTKSIAAARFLAALSLLAVSVGNSKSQLHKARKRLRKLLQKVQYAGEQNLQTTDHALGFITSY